MKLCIPVLAGLLLVVSFTNADVYFHNPRGSNNRLNEASTARANNNRMFNSQVSFKYEDYICSQYRAIFCNFTLVISV